jgi:hypothetical protein
MARFEIIRAERRYCAEIACSMRGDQLESVISLGLDPYRELVEAFDETPHPMALLIDGELAAMGGAAGQPDLCPIGIAWLVVAEHAVRFRRALVREIKRQLEIAHEVYPLLVSPLCPADKKSLRFAAFLGFAVEHAYPQDGLLFAVCGKKQKPNMLQLQEAA